MNVESYIKIDFEELSGRRLRKLIDQLTFTNEDGQVVQCYRLIYSKGYIKIPRGAWNLVDDLEYVDLRSKPVMPALGFKVMLDDLEKDKRFEGQTDAVNSMFKYQQGQIIRAPGTGKTQIALAFIAKCQTRTLVLVHTHDILKQWADYAKKAIPELEIGIIQGPNDEVKHLTIATVQTIRKYISQRDKEWWQQFGAIICDEQHHAAAPTFENVINWCPAFYRFGLTASATRADGMHPAIKFIIGPVIHKQKFSSAVKLSVVPVRTNFKYPYRGYYDWARMVERLALDECRNRQIAGIVDKESLGGNSILVLSRRIDHLKLISSCLECEHKILTGELRKIDRNRILDEFRSGITRVVLATQLADEALDVPRLNRVVLTYPGKHEGRLIQQVGRIIREFPKKKDAVIYDVVDWRMNVLRKQWMKRKVTYRKSGIKIKGVLNV